VSLRSALPQHVTKKDPIMLLSTSLAFVLATVAGTNCDPVAGLVVTSSPSPAIAGQFVTLTVSNVTTDCTFLVDVCQPTKVYEHECGGPLVAQFPCMLPAFHPIAPQQSIQLNWFPKDQEGDPLPEGNYTAALFVGSDAGGFSEVCVDVQIGGLSCPTSSYGTGKAVGLGAVPRIFTSGGFAKIGNSNFGLTIDDGPFSAAALVLVGAAQSSFQAPWGTLLVDVGAPHLAFPVALTPAPFAGQGGVAIVSLPIPNLPSLVGITAHAQALVVDPQPPFGIGHTAGRTFTICN
jgi:hypothetical protein